MALDVPDVELVLALLRFHGLVLENPETGGAYWFDEDGRYPIETDAMVARIAAAEAFDFQLWHSADSQTDVMCQARGVDSVLGRSGGRG